MKFTKMDKAALFLGTGMLALSYIYMKNGETRAGICFILGGFGCAVMLYASHSNTDSNKKNKK